MVTNIGSTAQSVTSSIAGQYTVTPAGTQSLPTNGASALYTVKCAPTTLGAQPGTLAFNGQGASVNYTMNCNGVVPGTLQVTPLPGNFSPTLVGRAPADLDITIHNLGGPTMLIVSLAGVLVPQMPDNVRGDAAQEAQFLDVQDGRFAFMTGPMDTVGFFDVFHQRW